MKCEIIELCNDIKKNNSCNNCGGRHNNYTCFYCGNENEILMDLEGKLVEKLNNFNDFDDFDEDILMGLFSIKSLNIEYVSKILDSYNYMAKLENKYNEICNKINNGVISNDEHKYMLYFLKNNIIIKDRHNEFINILMKEMLLDKLDVSKEMKMDLIKIFTEMVMKGKVKNPRCTFDVLEDNTVGESFFNRIVLDGNEVNDMLDNKKYINLLETIFHECTHTYQTYIMNVDKIVNYSNLLQTKEEIISRNMHGYYNENYVNYSSEVEARFIGANLTMQYLNLLNLKLDNYDFFYKIINREEQLFMNQNRVIAGKDTTVDELFLSLDLDNGMELLDRYPVLGVEFKVCGNAFVKKSMEELMNDYDNYKNGSLKLNGKNEDIEFLYNYLIENAKRYKERS